MYIVHHLTWIHHTKLFFLLHKYIDLKPGRDLERSWKHDQAIFEFHLKHKMIITSTASFSIFKQTVITAGEIILIL